MANNTHFILMGDIIKSRTFPAPQLYKEFSELLNSCNKNNEKYILSPYAVTLGDEFQGLAKSAESALKTIFYLEEDMLARQFKFKIRYVLLEGAIDTPINTRIAYRMLGKGLTTAREMLDKKKRTRRFRFEIENKTLENRLVNLFIVYEEITRKWPNKDQSIISEMINSSENEIVGRKFQKTHAQIWKRRRNLQINGYNAIVELALDVAKS